MSYIVGADQGWQCPVCHRVWAPTFPGPCTCEGKVAVTTTTATTVPKECPCGGEHDWAYLPSDSSSALRSYCLKCGVTKEAATLEVAAKSDYPPRPDGSVVLPICPDCDSPLIWEGNQKEKPNVRPGALWWCPVCEEIVEVAGE